jgi:adenine-specific DNA-methyltransferase
MNPFYQDDRVTLYHGDSLEVLPQLDCRVDVLLTDPPYFKVKQDEWDNQWSKAHEFLAWLGSAVDAAKPLLEPHASVWVFASPAMTSSVERLVGERFRVLNSIRWVKSQGWHQKAEIAALRSYLTPWEGVIFAEQFADAYGDAAMALHRQVFAPIGRYIQQERERAGFTRKQLAARLSGYKNLESATANVSNWELGKNLISAADYMAARDALNNGGTEYLRREYEDLRREYEDLRREYEDLRREYEDLRRPFNITSRAVSTDVWTFPTVSPYVGKHPCEKPGAMLRHMIETSSKPGQVILDPFAGSGSTLEVARACGRRAIGVEKDEAYCEKIAARLSQETLEVVA